MTMILDPITDTPAQVQERNRQARALKAVRTAEIQLALATAVFQQGGMDPIEPWGAPSWKWDPKATEPDWDDLDRDEQRRRALAWLRRHFACFREVQARMSARHDWRFDVSKKSDDYDFGFAILIRHYASGEAMVLTSITVAASITCEMVPTGETQTIDAIPAREVPVLKKVCPPSILADVSNADLDLPDDAPTITEQPF